MWRNPLPLKLLPTYDPMSFLDMSEGYTGLPLSSEHPGSFGFERKHHTHEGVDLYCPEGTPVMAVEPGEVVAILPFTGVHATPPSPWWMDTWAIMVEGETGVVLYGEIIPSSSIAIGQQVHAGDVLGHVTRVLTVDKGRPTSMLHLELYEHGARESVEWSPHVMWPEGLCDPTRHLLRVFAQQLDEALALQKAGVAA